MKCKKSFFLLISVALLSNATRAPQPSPQNITGTWEGLYGVGKYYLTGRGVNYHWGKDSFYLHMELHQTDRKIVGLFYYSPIRHPDRPIVMYQVSGLLDKKNPFAFFRLAMDGIMEDNTGSRLAEQLFRYMEAIYTQSDGSEVLYGNWYPAQGTGGVYWVKRVSTSVGPRLQTILDKKKMAATSRQGQMPARKV